MLEMHYETDNHNNYVIIESQALQKEVSYQEKMVVHNTIPNLLPVKIREINNQKQYCYNITRKQQMEKLYEFTKLQYEDIVMLCENISEMVKSVNSYMLDTSHILLNPQCIYIDVTRKKVSFLYHFEESTDFREQLKEFFGYLLELYDHQTDKMELMHIYGIYQHILQGEYDETNLKELCIRQEAATQTAESAMQEMSEKHSQDEVYQAEKEITIPVIPKEEIQTEQEVAVRAPAWMQIVYIMLLGLAAYIAAAYIFPDIALMEVSFPMTVVSVVILICLAKLLKNQQKKLQYATKIEMTQVLQPFRMNKQKTPEMQSPSISEYEKEMPLQSVFETEAEQANSKQDMQSLLQAESQRPQHTMLLSDYLDSMEESQQQTKEKQLFLKGSEDFEITSFPCIVGSGAVHCTQVINHPLISRMHICIIKKDEGFFFEDMNSTNGTYLNEERILPGQEKQLVRGDVLRLATEAYTVEIV